MVRKIIYVLSALAFLFSLLLIRDCVKYRSLTNSDSKIVLQFERMGHFSPLGEFFEIIVDLEAKVFSRPKKLENLPGFEDSLYQSGRIKDSALQALRTEGEVVKIFDVSPDKRWASVIVKTKSRHTRPPVLCYQVYLINVDKSMIAKEISFCESLYFSNDSNSYFFDEVLDLRTMDVTSQEVTQISPAQAFLLMPRRDKFLVFYEGEIFLLRLDGTKKKVVGTHKNIARESGIINKKWGYFLTHRGPKAGGCKLFFINLSNYNIIRYPYRLYKNKLIRVIPSDSSAK